MTTPGMTAPRMTAPRMTTPGRARRRGVVFGLCLAVSGCSSMDRQVMAPPNPDNPMTQPPANLETPCAGLTPAQRAATPSCPGPSGS